MTNTQKEDYYTQSEILFHFKQFKGFVFKKWWVLGLSIIVGGVIGFYFYNKQQPKYKAETTFILEEKSSGGGGLSGLAAQFGINVGGLSGGSMFSGDNILNILTSKKVVEEVLLSRVNEKGYNNKTLADIYLDYTGIRKGWQKNDAFKSFNFNTSLEKMSPIQDSILNNIYSSLIKKDLQAERTSKGGTIIKVKATAGDCAFARIITERLAEQASKLYLDVKTSNAQANIQMLQRRSDSLLSLLNRKSYTAAVSQPLDFNPGVKAAIVPVEIATRDKTVLATLYAEVTKSLEMSKLMLSQQTPVIQILDRPSMLLDDNKKGLAFLLIVFSFVAGTLCFFGLIALYFLKNFKNV